MAAASLYTTAEDYARYDSPVRIFTKSIVDKGMKEAVKVFHELKRQNPDDFNEGTMNGLGYTFLNEKKTKETIAIYKLNVEAYPGSANVYDSLAEGYMNDGDIDLAIKCYKKTLEMIPKDTKADQMALENFKRGAIENLEKIEEKKKLAPLRPFPVGKGTVDVIQELIPVVGGKPDVHLSDADDFDLVAV